MWTPSITAQGIMTGKTDSVMADNIKDLAQAEILLTTKTITTTIIYFNFIK